MPELDLTPEPSQTPGGDAQASGPLPDRIDHYDILGRLGAGGMGEVFLARDRRLGRQVALKMLAGRYTGDQGLRDRFLSEARAVSALEHPHICRLYDVGEWENRPYFTMERLRGETLRDRLRRGPMGAQEIRRIGAEVAEALAAAHERGILHCDVKPSNLFLTDGGAKVMDFGIARRLHAVPGAVPASEDSTVSGAVSPGYSPAGTPYYMAPEQVRGEDLDGRADVFSLGSVLYEMATGRSPFHAQSVVEVYAAILREKQAPLTIVDTQLASVINGALVKDRESRIASAAAMGTGLRTGLPVASLAGAQPVKARPNWHYAAAGVLAVAIAALVWFRPVVKIAPPRLTPLVSNAGDKDSPSLSPSGDRVVFAWTNEQGNNVDIYVKMVNGGPPLRITSNPLTDTNPVWSPDGQRIAFLRTGAAGVNTENGYYIVPALGGEERRVAQSWGIPNMNGGGNLAWSADGRTLVFCDKRTQESPAGMHAVDVETQSIRTLIEFSSPRGYVANPVFSPDGSQLAYTRGPNFISHDLFAMDWKTGTSRQLTHELRSIGGIAWEGGGAGLVFSSNRLGLFSLWHIDAAGGEPQRLNVGTADAVSPSIAPGANRLSYLSRRLTINLWRYPLEGTAPPQRLVSSTRISTEADYSPDGQRIAFASERSGSWEIWTTRADGSQPLQLTNMPGQQSASPRWSPDSQSIIFDTRFEGHGDLALIGAQGEGMRRLTSDPSDEYLPRFSRDGKSIYFFSNRGGSSQLWRMPAPSQPAAPPVRLTLSSLTDAVESLDRKFLYVTRKHKLWRMPIDAVDEQGLEEVLPKMFWRDFALVPDGVIYATGWVNLNQTIEHMSWATGQKKKLLEIGPRPNLFGPFVVSPDRKYLLSDRVDQQNIEIIMVDNFR